MRVTQRTPDVLVIEEDAGAVSGIIGWTNEEWVLVVVGAVFALLGIKIFLFSRTRTHRFERWRGTLAVDSKGLWGSKRRELPLDRIADIVVEEIRGRGRPSYHIHYVTADGERIQWSDFYDGSKENTLACFQAAREFLGMAKAPASADDKPARG